MTERKLITTPQIDEQLNVSTPQRVVIVHCSLIEGAKEEDAEPRRLRKRLCPALTHQTHTTARRDTLHFNSSSKNAHYVGGLYAFK